MVSVITEKKDKVNLFFNFYSLLKERKFCLIPYMDYVLLSPSPDSGGVGHRCILRRSLTDLSDGLLIGCLTLISRMRVIDDETLF